MIINKPLPKGRVWQFPTELEDAFDGVEDIGYGPRWMGAKIRNADSHIELGGPKNGYKSYLFTEVVENENDIVDGKFELIGPDIQEVPPGSSFPVGIYYRIWGPLLTDEYVEYLEREKIQIGWDHIEHLMLINARNTIWIRVGKGVADRLSFAKVNQIVYACMKTTFPLIKKVEIQMIVGAPEVGGQKLVEGIQKECEREWDIVDAKYLGIDDEDVDNFYGCVICQTFAPNHMCVITPNRLPYCGILSYNGAKITMQADPHGYVCKIPKGNCLNEKLGIYDEVNRAVYNKSNQTVKKVSLYSSIKYPQTNCGCFECASFYIPDLDAMGVVSRGYFGDTPLGVPFAKMAAIMSGGSQNNGFMGTSVRAIRMKRFLQGDGGWDRVVWVDKELKVQVADAIPEELYDKIATEDDALDIDQVKQFLTEKKHPIIEKYWKNGEPVMMTLPGPGEDWPDEDIAEGA